MEKIILVDGSSIIFRAYYALPKFSTSTGIPTSAVYGFIRMLLRILKDEKPNYLAVAFDKKAPTFRHIEYKEYKSQRPKMPDDLSIQFDIVKEVLGAFNIKYFELDGFEADDIIATFVEKLKDNKNLLKIILSSDFDLAQLIDEHVELFVTRRGVTKIEKYDVENFKKEFGFEPKFFVDYKALVGDVSDNIEGIKGIGKKTGAKLIQEFETIENIINNKEILEKFGICENTEKLLTNKSLCTLIRDVPISFDLEELRLKDFKVSEVKQSLLKYEFNSILKELDFEDTDLDVNIFSKRDTEKQELWAVDFDNLAIVFVDFPPKFAKDREVKDVHLLYKDRYIDFDFSSVLFLNEKDVALLKNILEDKSIVKYTNSLKHLYKIGEKINAVINNVLLDSSVAVYLLDPDLEEFSIEKLTGFLSIPLSSLNYKEEMLYLQRHGRELLDLLKKEGLDFVYEHIELPLAEVLFEMEKKGIKVDVEYFKSLKTKIDKDIEALEQDIYKLASISFNILSPKQLSSVLFDVLGIEFPKDVKEGTGTNVLMELYHAHPIIPLIVKYRHLVKLRNTYIEPIPRLVSKETGRLHTTYHQLGTATGRLRSTDPNLQNLPVKDEWGVNVERGFVVSSSDRVLVSADYSQIELRILAHLSRDENLVNAFLDDKDIHTMTACEIFNLRMEDVSKEKRNLAKAINFGIIYGISPYGLSREVGISKDEAKEYIEHYFRRYPKVKAYIEEAVENAKRKREVRTILGRRRLLKDLDESGDLREVQRRIAINSPIQGSASDIIKLAMVEIKKKCPDVDMLLQIHDELVFEVEKEKLGETVEKIKDIMEHIVQLNVPLKVDIASGSNLGDVRR